MTVVYFDSSALVKLVIEESGSELAAKLWDGSDAALSSRLAYPEVRAALAAADRSHDIDRAGLAQAQEMWEEFWPAVRPIELTSAVERHAGVLAARHALRGADAVHLASALVLTDGDVVMAAWDKRLRAGAEAAGLAIAPAELTT